MSSVPDSVDADAVIAELADMYAQQAINLAMSKALSKTLKARNAAYEQQAAGGGSQDSPEIPGDPEGTLPA